MCSIVLITNISRTIAPIYPDYKSTFLMQLGNIAQRVGRMLNIDPKNGHIINDQKASEQWSRTY